MLKFRRAALTAIALPVMLAISACSSETAEEGALPQGEAIAHVAPPAGQAWTEIASETPEGGFVLGNPAAPLKLVEYASHTCGVCANFSVEAHPAIDGYIESGVVSYEIRNQVHHPVDLAIAILARCSGPAAFHPLAGQAWANFEEVMAPTQTNGAALAQAVELPPEQRMQAIAEAAGLLDFFAARGISRDQGLQCLANTALATEIAERSEAQSKEFNVTGTPTFFLNGARVDGTAWSVVEPALQSAGAR
jgi:protein-disulfide isomerase